MKKILSILLLCVFAVGCKSGKPLDFTNFGKELLKAPEKKTESKTPSNTLSALSKSFTKTKKEEENNDPKLPDKIIAIWKQSVLTSPAGPIRGFAGRVYFHGRDDRPHKVDGELTVYAFNDHGKGPFKETKAIKKFVFRRQDLPRQHSQSELGHSYSIWLPFDKVGGPNRPLALMPIFRDAKNRTHRSRKTGRLHASRLKQLKQRES